MKGEAKPYPKITRQDTIRNGFDLNSNKKMPYQKERDWQGSIPIPIALGNARFRHQSLLFQVSRVYLVVLPGIMGMYTLSLKKRANKIEFFIRIVLYISTI
jgi:hypothetical protein